MAKTQSQLMDDRRVEMAEYEHSFPNGTVSVKLHKTRRLTLIVAREELERALVERLEQLEAENKILRRKVTELSRG